jgi:hypothetical protein
MALKNAYTSSLRQNPMNPPRGEFILIKTSSLLPYGITGGT